MIRDSENKIPNDTTKAEHFNSVLFALFAGTKKVQKSNFEADGVSQFQGVIGVRDASHRIICRRQSRAWLAGPFGGRRN